MRGVRVDAVLLVNLSAENALTHASKLRDLLRELRDSPDPELRACCQEMHDLIADLATVRNAAVLLKAATAEADAGAA